VYASKYRKNFELNHIYQKVVNEKAVNILAFIWDTIEIVVGKQAGSPTNPDLTKYASDSFKLY